MMSVEIQPIPAGIRLPEILPLKILRQGRMAALRSLRAATHLQQAEILRMEQKRTIRMSTATGS